MLVLALPDRLQHRLRDIEFRQLRSACQFLDRRAIAIAAREIHLRERTAIAQQLVHQAYALEHVGPIDRRDHPHAGDDVADRDAHGRLALVHLLHDGVGRGALCLEPFFQPKQHRGGLRILIAQALHQPHGKGRVQRPGGDALKHFGKRCFQRSIHAQDGGGHKIGVDALGTVVDDPRGGPAQVFHQHDPQRDRDCPKLPDGQRLDTLIGAHEAVQHLDIEAAVGMRDESPGDAEDPRIARERPGGQLGQLVIEFRRQVAADLPDLRFNDVIIVDQPLRRRRL